MTQIDKSASEKPKFFERGSIKRIVAKSAVGGAAGYLGRNPIYQVSANHLSKTRTKRDDKIIKKFDVNPEDFWNGASHLSDERLKEYLADLNNSAESHLKKKKILNRGHDWAPEIGTGVGAAKGIYDEVKRYHKQKKEYGELNKSAELDKEGRSKNVKRMVAKLSPESQNIYERHRNGYGFLDSINAGYSAGHSARSSMGNGKDRIRKIQDIKDRNPDFSVVDIRSRYDINKMFTNMSPSRFARNFDNPLVMDGSNYTRRDKFNDDSRINNLFNAKRHSSETKRNQIESKEVSKGKIPLRTEEPFLRDTPEWKKKQDEQKKQEPPLIHSQDKPIENKTSFSNGAKIGAGALTVAGLYGAYKLKKHLDKKKEHKEMNKSAELDKEGRSKNVKRMVAKLSPEKQREYEISRGGFRRITKREITPEHYAEGQTRADRFKITKETTPEWIKRTDPTGEKSARIRSGSFKDTLERMHEQDKDPLYRGKISHKDIINRQFERDERRQRYNEYIRNNPPKPVESDHKAQDASHFPAANGLSTNQKLGIGAGIVATAGGLHLINKYKKARKQKKEHNEMNKAANLKDRFKRIARSAGKGALVGGVAGAAGANPLHSARDLVRAADERSYRQGYSDMSHGEPTSLDNLSPRNRADHIKSGDKGYKDGKYSEPNINLQREELKLLMAERDVHKKRTILTKAKSAMNGGAAGALIGGALGAGRQAYKEIKDSRMNKEASSQIPGTKRLEIKRPSGDRPRTNYNDILTTHAVKSHFDPARPDYSGDRPNLNNSKAIGAKRKYLANMNRLGENASYGKDPRAMDHFRNVAKGNRLDHAEGIMDRLKNVRSRVSVGKEKRRIADEKHEMSKARMSVKSSPKTPPPVIDITPKIEAKKQQEAAPQKKRSIRYHQLTESEKRSRAHHDPQMARENNNAVFYQTEGSSKPNPKLQPETKKRSIRHHRLSEDEKVNRIGKHPKYDSEYMKAKLHEHEKDNSSFATGKSGLSTKQKLGIGGGVAATAGALYLANKYRKHRKAKREAEAGQNKIAALFDGSHEVNIGKDTRDWVDSKTKKMSDAAAKIPKMTSDVATKAKSAVSPHLTARNAAIGAGALAVYKGGKAIKRHIKNKMDDRAAKNKEDDRINYYKGQMDTHKDNAHMLRALTSRMSKEKFDA